MHSYLNILFLFHIIFDQNLLNINLPDSMKKYQLWLERKSYSQHLINLLKIKSSLHTPQSLPKRYRKHQSNHEDTLNSSNQTRIRQPHKLCDISYPVLNRELNNKKYRLLREFEVNNENQNMARRMKSVKSVLNLHRNKHSSSTSFYKQKQTQKKYEQSNDELRQEKFRRYMKWQNTSTSNLHKAYLSIEIINISKMLRVRDDYAGLWCELQSDKALIRSQMGKLDIYQTYKFRFPFDQDLSDDLTLKIYTCKGIDCEKLGEFAINKPRAGRSDLKWIKSLDGKLQIQVKINYHQFRKNKICADFK